MRKRSVVLRRATEEPSRNSSTASSLSVRYGECQKNHAAAVGGYAVDGCREFMASSGEEGSVASLTCAACSCHRSFHRRIVESEASSEYDSPSSNGN